MNYLFSANPFYTFAKLFVGQHRFFYISLLLHCLPVSIPVSGTHHHLWQALSQSARVSVVRGMSHLMNSSKVEGAWDLFLRQGCGITGKGAFSKTMEVDQLDDIKPNKNNLKSLADWSATYVNELQTFLVQISKDNASCYDTFKQMCLDKNRLQLVDCVQKMVQYDVNSFINKKAKVPFPVTVKVWDANTPSESDFTEGTRLSVELSTSDQSSIGTPLSWHDLVQSAKQKFTDGKRGETNAKSTGDREDDFTSSGSFKLSLNTLFVTFIVSILALLNNDINYIF